MSLFDVGAILIVNLCEFEDFRNLMRESEMCEFGG